MELQNWNLSLRYVGQYRVDYLPLLLALGNNLPVLLNVASDPLPYVGVAKQRTF